MLGSNGRSVNVSRLVLLAKLKENLEIHKKDYVEAVAGYKVKLVLDLRNALAVVENTKAEDLVNVNSVSFNFPPNYESNYTDVIEMMEMSVDETINLDSQSFKQYIKNEWNWSSGFMRTTSLYKSFNGLGGAAGSAG